MAEQETPVPPSSKIAVDPEFNDTIRITVQQGSGVRFVFTVPTSPLVPPAADLPLTVRVAGSRCQPA